MFRHCPHYPHNARAQIYNLPVGHWFFLAYERLARTPEPEEVMADRPPADLIRPSELELHVALWNISRAGEENDENGEGAIRGEAREVEVDDGEDNEGHNRREVYHVEVLAPAPVQEPQANQLIVHDFYIELPTNTLQVDIVNRYRHEILRDWINDIFATNGLGQFRLNGDYVNHDEISTIVED